MYYNIDEEIARTAQELNSFRAYEPGSATAEYRRQVDAAAAIAEEQKNRVSSFYHAKIDALLDAYASRLAAWTNDHNRNRASCPSVLVSGAGNFPVGKKQRQNAREDTLMAEYDKVAGIIKKIQRTGTGPVDLADPDARKILAGQLETLENRQKREKALNAWYRKTGSCAGCPGVPESVSARVQAAFAEIVKSAPYINAPFPDYELTGLRNKIKRLRERIEQLDKLDAEKVKPSAAAEFDGFRAVRNAELNRLQIFFSDVPAADIRQSLRSNGFRWAPSQGAWQRQLTDNAIRAAEQILGVSL